MHFTRDNNVNTLFSNTEIPGFGLSSSQDFGIEKRSRIPGLQSLYPAKCNFWFESK